MEHLIKETARKFRRANRALMRIIDKKVSTTQLYRGQHQVLMNIAHNPSASQAEIADIMEISPAALAVSLKKLEKGGYIKRNSDISDERKKRIEMTELGESIVAESHRMFQEVENQMFQGFSEEEICKLALYLDRLNENLLDVQNCNKEEK
ncbi:MAG: MarR family transcriptional regulator [Lachnospiraceae bacterium]|nr:MarR family transcriptional regulator [Lachnospiraceae bacterium]